MDRAERIVSGRAAIPLNKIPPDRVHPGMDQPEGRPKRKRAARKPRDDGETSTAAPKPLPRWIQLFFNILLVAALALLPAVAFSRFGLFPCVPPTIAGLCCALLVFVVLHLACRYELLKNLKWGGRWLRFDRLDALLKALHPWGFSSWAIWSIAFLLAATALFLWFSPLSPVRLEEAPPAVQGFSMQPSDGRTQKFAVGGRIKIPFGGSALIQAVVERGNSSCTWSAVHGRALPESGCTARYLAPMEEVRDTVSVFVKSPCGPGLTSARFHIEVTRNRT